MGSMYHALNPSNIRFTRIAIESSFETADDNRGRNIGETLDDLYDGVCAVWDIDPIRVFYHDGQWWSVDNRRLWVFRSLHALARCSRIPVKNTTRESILGRMFMATNGEGVVVEGKIVGRSYKTLLESRRRKLPRSEGQGIERRR